MKAVHVRLLITIHDVTPAHQARVEELWRLCAAHGVVPGLLVVPEWHGGWRIERDAAFGDWVRSRAAEGAEILLHGERHDEAGFSRTWRDELRAFGRTDGEGEFLTLGYDEARDRIDRGVERLRTMGLEPVGFVPPAWLCRVETHEAVRDAGLEVSEDDSMVYVHATGETRKAPVLRWSARGVVRAYGSVVQEWARWGVQQEVELMRIALHPSDLEYPVTAKSVERALQRWMAVGEQLKYGEVGRTDGEARSGSEKREAD